MNIYLNFQNKPVYLRIRYCSISFNFIRSENVPNPYAIYTNINYLHIQNLSQLGEFLLGNLKQRDQKTFLEQHPVQESHGHIEGKAKPHLGPLETLNDPNLLHIGNVLEKKPFLNSPAEERLFFPLISYTGAEVKRNEGLLVWNTRRCQ